MGICNPASGGGGTSLTGWETDADGNLVNTGGGDLVAGALATPIRVKSKFVGGGPQTEADGIVFEAVSDNWNYDDTPANVTLFRIDEYNVEAQLLGGTSLVWRDNAGGRISAKSADGATTYVDLQLTGSQAGDKPGSFALTVRDDTGANQTAIEVLSTGQMNLGSGSAQVWLAGGAWKVSELGKLIPSLAHDVTGDRSDGTALTNLLVILDTLGFITNSTVA